MVPAFSLLEIEVDAGEVSRLASGTAAPKGDLLLAWVCGTAEAAP